jgi:hypothetical protein
MKHRVVVMILALFVVSGALAHAQTGTIEIGFPFVAGGKAFAPGKYTIEMPDANSIALRSASGSAIMVVLTQLGRHDKDRDCELVFDKVGDKSLLSEVWFPDRDGYLVLSSKEAHTHAVVGGSNPRR